MSALYTVVSEANRSTFPDVSSLRTGLEKGSDEDRIRVMTSVLSMTLDGDALPHLLMDIIRFVLPSKNKTLKKLLHSYWEIVPKHDPQGKLRQEMILVVNAIRNDLQHPNEYIRGGTLRFLTKFREPELLEPLVPTIRQNLEHRHAYVRKNAVFCILAISQSDSTNHLVPDAADLLATFLEAESDATCRRNAFVALTELDRGAAYAYFHKNYATMAAADELLQLAFIDFMANDAVRTPSMLPSYTQILQGWLSQGSNVPRVVAYEAATALVELSNDPTVLADVAAAYLKIALRETDNNVKITALGRVRSFADDEALSHLVMDVLLVLSVPDIAVRLEALDLAMQLVSSRTVDQVIRLLKKELSNSFHQSYDAADEYREAIIGAIHKIAKRFPDSAAGVVGVLLEFLGDLNGKAALDVVRFVREIVELHPDQRSNVMNHLLDVFHTIRRSRALLGALWIIGEYCETKEDVVRGWKTLREATGPVPFDQYSNEDDDAETTAAPVPHTKGPRVLADGTYATESPLDAAAAAAAAAAKEDTHYLRKVLLKNGFFVSCGLSVALTKLAIRFSRLNDDKPLVNKTKAEALLVMASLLRAVSNSINADSYDRIYGCINILIEGTEEAQRDFLERPHEAFRSLLSHDKTAEARKSARAAEKSAVRVEDPIKFRLFSKLDSTIKTKAQGTAAKPKKTSGAKSQLKQVTQLTGYSDPIYAEALMTVSQFDIVLDVMIFNQTTETLQNLAVEFFTTGDLEVIDSPTPVNVAPMSFHTARSTVRVSSADSACIFGDIAYEGKKPTVILLHDIRLNILDYIKPATCTNEEFVEKWNEFEWENKVRVSSTKEKSLPEYLESFMKLTNMACLTEGATDDKDIKFLSANLYARSSFGEDALANVCVELTEDGTIVGDARIRTEAKGPAVSIGERVSSSE